MQITNGRVEKNVFDWLTMSNAMFSYDVQDFILRLDKAVEAHLAWSRRVLRCAVLRTSPGEDVLAEDAHCRCLFGEWFRQNRESFDAIDGVAAQRLDEQHRQMHDAVRSICRSILKDAAGDAATLDAFEQTQAEVIADLALFKTQYLAHSSRLDALTGLPLRYGLEDEFKRCHAQAMRRGEQLTVVLFDVDHFKRVNDVHGHAVGDLALQHVARLLMGHCRAGEPLYRFGGEEFLALMQTADRHGAQMATERLLQALRDSPLGLPAGHELGLRASAGLAEVGIEESMADVVGRADRALYAAKAAGRNTWRFGTETH
jgi:diguanylate cyclase (GGDEF)-like protein